MIDKILRSENRRESIFRRKTEIEFRTARKKTAEKLRPFLMELDRIDREPVPKGKDPQDWKKHERLKAIDRYNVRKILLDALNEVTDRRLEAMRDELETIAEENVAEILKGETDE